MIIRPDGTYRAAPFLGFAGFGAFWGVWGATLPLLRAQAGVSDAEFGVVLLFIGAGALPAMLLTGRLVDALGLRVTGVLLALLGVMGVVLSAAAANYPALCAGILLTGAGSGAADVALNTLAATVEKRTGRPVVTRSHAAFSATVALSSLGAGALTAIADSLLVNFAAGAVVVVALGLAVVTTTRPAHAQDAAACKRQDAAAARERQDAAAPERQDAAAPERQDAAAPERQDAAAPEGQGEPARPGRRSWWVALVMIGAIGAFAFAAENAYQSWSAVLLTDAFTASPALAAVAPAAFATTAALTRFATGTVTLRRPIATLVTASAIATGGGVLTAFAPTLPLALGGIVAAAVGTSALFPTLLSYGLRPVPDGSRGRATSAISTVAYLGYLAGPAYFGLLADAGGVQRTFLGIAALTAVVLAAIPALKRADRRALVQVSRKVASAGPKAPPSW
ncbi:MFS transporter [Nonomuraea angiospora]|uniref:MFS transporter n=1 Tax=Nonomuraea angiospora TaxID=46172 RepID=UPI0029A52A37|nr:MFS transporter [Nonomuraea angiospora]MDX3099928.1 MFS transporter [Nonomuraea angiospora]